VQFAGKTDAIRVLLVEDDQNYREALTDELSDHGISVQSFADGASLLQALDDGVDADVVILDWALPNTSGIDLLPRMRRRGVNLPVVFLAVPRRHMKAWLSTEERSISSTRCAARTSSSGG
jgi:DNA-binding response OmpR family regulator